MSSNVKHHLFFALLIFSEMFHVECVPIFKPLSVTGNEEPKSSSTNVSPIKIRALSALANPIKSAYTKFRPALKLIGLFYIGFQMVNMLMPAMTSSWSSTQTMVADETEHSLSHAIGELGVSAMVEGWRFFDDDNGNGSGKAPQVLSTWQEQCKKRATCELGRSLSSRMPYISKVIGYFSSRIPFIGHFGEALTTGINTPDCSNLYPECPYVRPTIEEL